MLLPDFAGDVQFFNIKPPAANLNAIINHINTNGLTLYGSVVIVLEHDNFSSNLINNLQENLKNSLQVALDNIVGTNNFPPTNLGQTRDEILNALTQFDLKWWEWGSTAIQSIIGTDDDVVGVQAFVFCDLPQNIFNILGIGNAQIQTSVNLGTLLSNAAVNAIQNNVNDGIFNILQSLNVIDLIEMSSTRAQGIVSFNIVFGGTGYRHFYDNTALEFILRDQSSMPICRYNIRGDITQMRPPIADAPGTNRSICIPTCQNSTWLGDFGKINAGLINQNIHPRFVADINGDGINDVIAIKDRIWVAKGTGSSFLNSIEGNINFGTNGGWNNMNDHPRFITDINNDGRSDIVGFGNDGVRVALGNTGGSFTTASSFNMGSFGKSNAAGAWTNNSLHPRFVADVDGDGDKDIVGFSQTGVVVAKNMGSNFVLQPGYWSTQYCINTGWTNQDAYPRYVMDVNGDNKADIIGFSQTGVSVSLSNGTSFQSAATTWVANYGVNQGWSSQNLYNRQLVDINADGRIDVVGFGTDAVFVSLNNTLAGTNSFSSPAIWSTDFGRADGYLDNNTYTKLFGKINDDIYPDLIAFKGNDSYVSINTGTKFETTSRVNLGFENDEGYTNNEEFPRMLVSVDGTNRDELIGFSNYGIVVLNCATGTWWRTKENNTVEKKVFKIYPNPTHEILNFETNIEDNYLVLLYDTNGKMLLNKNFASSAFQIDLGAYSSGIYFVQIFDRLNNLIDTDKIILE